MTALQDKVTELAEKFAVPGVAVGLYADGEASYAFHGVTSIENPLPVNEDTLFQFGSTGKTYTATAIQILADQGKVDLNQPVKAYLPDFTLRDKEVEATVTVLQLLNHTAGWDGDIMTDTGDGDDALEKYLELVANAQQISPLGSTVSYNNSALSVAGAIIAKITGKTYEQAMHDLVFVPLGLSSTFFFRDDIMTRRFVVGHERHSDGHITVRRPWGLPRGNAPAGGMTCTASDYLTWAIFHLGDGTATDGTRVLSTERLAAMKEPTADMQGSALGDYVGISWLLRDVDGQRVVEHGGTTNGQHSDLVMVPAKGLAFTVQTNSGPNGPQLIDELRKWVLSTYAGIDTSDPEAVPLSTEETQPYLGSYETVAVLVHITDAGNGTLSAQIELKPEALATMTEAGEETPEQPAFPLGLLADRKRYVIVDGEAKGMLGYFAFDEAGAVTGVHLGGRLATRL